MRKLMKKGLLIACILILSCMGINLVLDILGQQSHPSQSELCDMLAQQLDRKSCMSYEDIRDILVVAFPKGEATRQEIFDAIGQYRTSSFTAENGLGYDTYEIIGSWSSRYLLPGVIDSQEFSFDQNGILENILFLT